MATTEKWAKLFKSRHQYMDSVPIQFGDAKDAAIAWDGTNLTLKPVTDDTGAFVIGDGTTDMDFKVFMNTTGKYVLFDQSTSLVTFVATALTLGADTTGTDLKLFGATTGNYLLWDASEDDLTLVGTATQLAVAGTTAATSATTGSIHTAGGIGLAGALWVGTTSRLVGNVQMDGTLIVGNDAAGKDFTVYGDVTAYKTWWDANADTNGTWYFGADTKGVDVKAYGATTGNYLHWDASADDLLLVGTATQLAVAGTTESTSTTTGSLRTAGGFATGGDCYLGDDVFLTSGAVINWNAGDVTITHSADALAFAGATAAGINGYSFDTAAGAIATEAHGVDITTTGTLASNKSLVGANVKVTAAGTAGSWLSGLFVNATQASKMVNGYLCAAEFELTSTAAGASDNSVIVLNSVRNHTGSPPACDPYITLREYGTTYGDAYLRIFGDTGQGAITGGASSTLLATGSADKAATCMIRCMFGSTVFWLLGTTNAPS